jgi:glycosyltransferase involved in cell wall biosynthesis
MNSKKLNILFLSSWYPNRVLPKLGNFVQRHAECVALSSNVVALHVCSDNNCKEKFELEESTINSVFTVIVYYKKVNHKIPVLLQIQKMWRYSKAHFIGLKRIYTKLDQIDIVHHNITYPAGIIALYLKKRRNIPYLITENWTGYLPSKKVKLSYFQKKISKIITRNAFCITPVSNDLKAAMISLGFNSNYEVVYNVVDMDLFKQKKINPSPQKVKILHVSSLNDAHKNISGILSAVSELAKYRTDFEVWFIGDSEDKSYMETAKKLFIYNTFAFFYGVKSSAEIAEIMRQADCFLLFSNYENLPCVMIEAFACGLPVISSSVGGIPEHISSERGILLPPNDEKKLHEAMSKMIDSLKSYSYNSSSIRAYANDNFSYKKVSQKFHQLYEKILNLDS